MFRGSIQDLDHEVKWGFPELAEKGRLVFVKDEKFRQHLKPIFNLKGNERILDVGCGIGTLCKLIEPFITSEGEIIGIDVTPSLMEYGNDHWANSPKIHLEIGDANRLDYPDESFDVVASMGLLECVSDVDHILTEMLRVLRHPGKLVVIHIDVLNFITIPEEKISGNYYQDLLLGKFFAGLDLQMSRFLKYCRKNRLSPKKFTYYQEERYEITDAFIRIMKERIKAYYQSKDAKIITQSFDFYYQFLKCVGWTSEQVRRVVDQGYVMPLLLKTLKAHVGEEYLRRTPIIIYSIDILK